MKRSILNIVVGVLMGGAFYVALSIAAWYGWPTVDRSTVAVLSIGVVLVALTMAVTMLVRHLSRRAVTSLAATMLVISGIILVSPAPFPFVDGTPELVALLQPGARFYVAPVFAATLLAMTAQRHREGAGNTPTASKPGQRGHAGANPSPSRK